MKQAIAKEISENPFYGKTGMLAMQKALERTSDDTVNKTTLNTTLARAWQDVSTQADKELFFILLFSMGDIENRQHNMFPGKVDQGGHSKRKLFRWCLNWVLTTPSVTDNFYKLMPVIAEYTNYENLFYNQIRSDAKSRKSLTWEALPIDKKKVAKFLVEKLKSCTPFDKQLIAKFLPKVPKSKRWRKDKDGKSFAQKKKDTTLIKDEWNKELIKAFREEAGLSLEEYMKWRSQHLKDTEAHLFSSKKIEDFDEIEFRAWLDQLPSGARYRVQRRLFTKETTPYSGDKMVSTNKWKLKGGKDMSAVYTSWVEDKEKAMLKLTALTEEDKKEMTAVELKQLEKSAKINTGASTIFDNFMELYDSYGRLKVGKESNVKIQQLVDKIKLDVPVLVILDNSPSMEDYIHASNGKRISRMEFATFAAALILYKNPSEEMKSFMMTFNSVGRVIHDGGYVESTTGKNRFVRTKNDVQLEELVKKGQPMIETFNQLRSIISTAGGTQINAVSGALKAWVDEDSISKDLKIEAIRNYPVWLIISDGDLNNSYSAKASMEQFKSEMMHWFGASPVVVLWDIKNDNSSKPNTFEGIDNFIHLTGFNPGILNQVFMNIDDLDIIDVFISLKTIHESDRYAPIKQLLKD